MKKLTTGQYLLICIALFVFSIILAGFLKSYGIGSTKTHDFIINLGLFCIGLSGIPMILRKESPKGIFQLKGFLAVLSGLSMILLFSITATYLMVMNFLSK
jgi:hypothetical protein